MGDDVSFVAGIGRKQQVVAENAVFRQAVVDDLFSIGQVRDDSYRSFQDDADLSAAVAFMKQRLVFLQFPLEKVLFFVFGQ